MTLLLQNTLVSLFTWLVLSLKSSEIYSFHFSLVSFLVRNHRNTRSISHNTTKSIPFVKQECEDERKTAKTEDL